MSACSVICVPVFDSSLFEVRDSARSAKARVKTLSQQKVELILKGARKVALDCERS